MGFRVWGFGFRSFGETVSSSWGLGCKDARFYGSGLVLCLGFRIWGIAEFQILRDSSSSFPCVLQTLMKIPPSLVQ